MDRYLLSSNDEIEPSKPPVAGLLHVKQKGFMKQPVSGVSRLSGKIQLGSKNTPTSALDLEMEMSCSPGIKCGHDRVEPPSPLGVGELMAAQTEADAVVFAVFVRMPNLDQAAGDWPAAVVEDETRDGYPFAAGCIGIEIALERRVRPEEGAGLPFEGEIVAIVA